MNPVHQSDPVQFAAGDRIEVIKQCYFRSVGSKGTIARVGKRPNGAGFADIKWDDGMMGYLYENLLVNNCQKITQQDKEEHIDVPEPQEDWTDPGRRD